jgi:hypothetical protein
MAFLLVIVHKKGSANDTMLSQKFRIACQRKGNPRQLCGARRVVQSSCDFNDETEPVRSGKLAVNIAAPAVILPDELPGIPARVRTHALVVRPIPAYPQLSTRRSRVSVSYILPAE